MSAQPPSIDDIAQLCGVSRALVSSVLSGTASGTVTNEVRQRVLNAADQLGYLPQSDRNVLSRPPGRVAVVDLGTMPPGLARVRGRRIFDRILTEYGFTVVWTPAMSPHSGVPALSPAVVAMRPDLLITVVPLPPQLARELRELGTRYVPLFQNSERLDKMIVEAALAQMEYLSAQGCRSVIYCGPSAPQFGQLNALRANAVAAYSQARGIAVGCFLAIANEREFAQQISEIEELPDAVVCFNDEVAAFVLAGAQRVGIEVPNQMKIIGVDNTELTEVIYPNITSVKYELRGSRGIESYMSLLCCSVCDPPRLTLRAVVVPRETA